MSIIALLLTLLFTTLPAMALDSSSTGHFQELVAQGVDPKALRVALKAYQWAKAHGKVKKPILTLVNFEKPSSKQRLWVIDVNSGRILYHGLVTHGKKSGGLYANHFSNRVGSKESSLGAMVTGAPYYGKHGLSVRINGLEPGINSHVAQRDIVFHKASYATKRFVSQRGALGRSWGCFAISPKQASYVFNTIKGGSFVFAYADEEQSDPLLS